MSASTGDWIAQADRLAPGAMRLVVTCEHGGNRVPPPYRYLFDDCRSLLESHRGFDPGARVMARELAGRFGAPVVASTVSRLVVDLNRSIGHRNLHMETIRSLPAAVREEIVERHYRPYRAEVEQLVAQGVAANRTVMHISCHSFTNELNGVVRDADIGLLYDPARPGEVAFCRKWKSALKKACPDLKVRRNFPYKGSNDGLTTSLREQFSSDSYLGVELEINQRNILSPPGRWTALREMLIRTLDSVTSGLRS